jgi:outer membrane protein assembly factor BamB
LLVTADSLVLVTASVENATGTETVLRSVSKQTGITNWFVKTSSAPKVTIGTVNGTVILVTPAGTISAFATNTGDQKWTKSVGANITTAPYFSGTSAFVGTDKNEVISFAASSGELAVAAKAVSVPAVVFSDSSGRVLVGDERGNLVLTSADGKRVWRFRNGARISAISTYDSEFLAASNDNFVYKLTRGGNVEWKRRLSSRIDGRPLVLDNVAVFATVGDGNVYVIDLTNGKVLNRFENGENNAAQAISAGANFVMVTEGSLTLYSRGACPANKKTAP